jgi:outer membrane immunogenic protein
MDTRIFWLMATLAAAGAAGAAELQGPYVGATAGWVGARPDIYQVGNGSTGRYDADGFIGGITGGYNWRNENWLLGVEADWSYSSAEGTSVGWCGLGCDVEVDWFATARGRVGYHFDAVTPYVTAGVALLREQDTNQVWRHAETAWGWTIGLGSEVSLDERISAKVEYLYSDHGDWLSHQVSGAPTDRATTDLHVNVVRAGLNYRFD